MQDGFEEVALSWIFTVKQLQQLHIPHRQYNGYIMLTDHYKIETSQS